jgi:uncharacterized membrane protein YphA (DoxX/SURF4 family)
MNEPTVVGMRPALPWPLARSRWWNDPVRAERLAALRVAVALVLLIDILTAYVPRATDFYGAGSLGDPTVFEAWRAAPRLNWSLLLVNDEPALARAATLVWAGAAALLLFGCASRLCAAIAWALSVSFFNLNVSIHNAGDVVRTILLFYLMLCPCGAVWSIDAWWRRRDAQGPAPAVLVFPWPLRLLFVQLVVIYFFNGLFKLGGEQWQRGDVLHFVMADVSQSRWSLSQLPMPAWGLQWLTWTVLVWEVTFPLLVLLPWARRPALWLGVAFHLGIAVFIELAMFCLYMLCLYVPLVSWEASSAARRT